MNLRINAATEGYPDEIAVHSLCRTAGLTVANIYNLRGKSTLDKNLRGYNNAAKSWYWLVLRDLDHDAECGAALRQQLIPSPSQFMHLRIVVREIESWLLADSAKFAQFLGVARSKFPEDPESLDYPKREVIRLASGSSPRERRRTRSRLWGASCGIYRKSLETGRGGAVVRQPKTLSGKADGMGR